jgi:hypothetical protein
VRVGVNEKLEGENAGKSDVEFVEGLSRAGKGTIAVHEAGVELCLRRVDDEVLRVRSGAARS